MRLRKPILGLGLALVLAGCGHDPYIHGPFLIGAEPADYYPEGCRPGDVRSHTAQNGWDACMTPAPAEGSSAVVVLAPLPPPPTAVVVHRSGSAPSGRSAWN